MLQISDFIVFSISRLRGLQRLQISDFIVFRISWLRGLQLLQNLRLYYFQDIKVAKGAKVAKFQTLSFSGYQSCKGWKGCKISDFIVFRISKLQNFRLYHFKDV